MQTHRELLLEGRKTLEEAEIADSTTDAWLLMEYITGMTRASYFMRENEEMSREQAEKYREMIRRRAQHIPLQHITHEAWFYGLKFYVDEHVLTPRQDTEVLVEEVLLEAGKMQAGSSRSRILDMCTGSGCILLALLSVLKRSGGGWSGFIRRSPCCGSKKTAESWEYRLYGKKVIYLQISVEHMTLLFPIRHI